jgi:MFS family permease
MTQDQIAAELGVSRQRAQRLVSRAMAEGLIHVRLNHRIGACLDLEARLRDRFGLDRVRVAPGLGTGADPVRAIAPAAANFAGPLVAGLLIDRAGPQAGDLIGYRWAFGVMAAMPLLCWAMLRGTPRAPVEAALEWSVQKSRRHGGARAGGFPGESTILKQLESGATRRRVGLKAEGRAPVREGAPLFADASSTESIGKVTSGGFGPSLNAPVAMGYVPSPLAAVGTTVFAEVRGQRLPLKISPTPFVPNTYKR